MRMTRRTGLSLSAALAGIAAAASSARAAERSGGLSYDGNSRSRVPIPPGERNLQTVVATPWLRVTDEPVVLEGPSVERDGNLVFCDATGGRIFRATRDGALSVVTAMEGASPGGTAIQPDGRILVAATADRYTRGWVVAIRPDGSAPEMIVPPEAGLVPNDLVLDGRGGFYLTDFRGTSTEGAGGVYHVAPGRRAITPILRGLSLANGVALTDDGATLWVGEHGRNLLHRIRLADATTIRPLGTSVAYAFSGPAPDSMRADRDGNLYVAMMGQGRVLVMGRNGVPIGQILVPNRDDGYHLDTASLALNPDDRDLYIMAGDRAGGRGAWIFRSQSFAPAPRGGVER